MRVPRACWKHLDVMLFFKLKYLLKEAHEFHLTLFWLASNLAETRLAYFCTVSYENFVPKMFDERVTKEFISAVIVVLLEDTQKQALPLIVLTSTISFPRLWEKQAKHLDCVLLAAKLDWQSKILAHEPLYIIHILLV